MEILMGRGREWGTHAREVKPNRIATSAASQTVQAGPIRRIDCIELPVACRPIMAGIHLYAMPHEHASRYTYKLWHERVGNIPPSPSCHISIWLPRYLQTYIRSRIYYIRTIYHIWRCDNNCRHNLTIIVSILDTDKTRFYINQWVTYCV